MADAKIEIKVGEVTFSGEGDSDWLSSQLDKLLAKIPELSKVSFRAGDAHKQDSGEAGGQRSDMGIKSKQLGTLASFLGSKNATTNQVRKFLATSVWLHDREGKERITTRDVTRSLSDAHQSRLGNPADCLNRNVSKGFCEKVGKEFYVTPEGRSELG